MYPHGSQRRQERNPTYLKTGDGEVGDEADDFGVVLHLDQLPQLVVTF